MPLDPQLKLLHLKTVIGWYGKKLFYYYLALFIFINNYIICRYIFRQALRIDSEDPQLVISELKSNCLNYINKKAKNLQSNSRNNIDEDCETISIIELWNIIVELRLRGGMNKDQFYKSIQYLVTDGKGNENDTVDFHALCRYISRMGKCYYNLEEDKKISNDAIFQEYWSLLKKELSILKFSTEYEDDIMKG